MNPRQDTTHIDYCESDSARPITSTTTAAASLLHDHGQQEGLDLIAFLDDEIFLDLPQIQLTNNSHSFTNTTSPPPLLSQSHFINTSHTVVGSPPYSSSSQLHSSWYTPSANQHIGTNSQLLQPCRYKSISSINTAPYPTAPYPSSSRTTRTGRHQSSTSVHTPRSHSPHFTSNRLPSSPLLSAYIAPTTQSSVTHSLVHKSQPKHIVMPPVHNSQPHHIQPYQIQPHHIQPHLIQTHHSQPYPIHPHLIQLHHIQPHPNQPHPIHPQHIHHTQKVQSYTSSVSHAKPSPTVPSVQPSQSSEIVGITPSGPVQSPGNIYPIQLPLNSGTISLIQPVNSGNISPVQPCLNSVSISPVQLPPNPSPIQPVNSGDMSPVQPCLNSGNVSPIQLLINQRKVSPMQLPPNPGNISPVQQGNMSPMQVPINSGNTAPVPPLIIPGNVSPMQLPLNLENVSPIQSSSYSHLQDSQQRRFCPVHSVPAVSSPSSSNELLFAPIAVHKAGSSLIGVASSSAPPISPPHSCKVEEEKELQEDVKNMKVFTRRFKEQREKFDYSQDDVAQQVSIRYSFSLCEGKVKLFETCSLSISEMKNLKYYLEMWVLDTARTRGATEDDVKELWRWLTNYTKPRRQRTPISADTKLKLEQEFQIKPKPSQEDFKMIANRLDIKAKVVRTWFCNRRQRMRQEGEEEGGEEEENEYPSPSSYNQWDKVSNN